MNQKLDNRVVAAILIVVALIALVFLFRSVMQGSGVDDTQYAPLPPGHSEGRAPTNRGGGPSGP